MTSFAKIKALPRGAKILTLTMALTILSFFVQSALPPRISSGESDAVAGFLSRIFSPESCFGRFVIDNLRKIGHFVEYGALGIQTALFVFLYAEKKNERRISFKFAFGALTVALLDETTQIFSGRGPAILDVWIDFFGYCSFYLLSFAVLFAFSKIVKTSKEKHNG